MTHPALRLIAITKQFGPVLANNAVSLSLNRGEALGLIGENGAGKTTLMSILFGHYQADSGEIEVEGAPLPQGDPAAALKAGVAMVHQHFTLAERMSVLENVMLGARPLTSLRLKRGQARAKLMALSRDYGLEVHPDARIDSLTVGEKQRVEILKALWRDARILILDEPTAVLTPQECDRLFEALKAMKARGLSLIFISHKLAEVAAICDRAAVLRGGKLVGEAPMAGATRDRLAAMMIGAEPETPDIAPGAPGEILLQLTGARAAAPEGGVGLAGVDLDLRAGEIFGVAGVSGNGQSALAALVAGVSAPQSGEMRLHGAPVARWSPAAALRAGIGRIPEDRHAEGLIADMSVAENMISETRRSRRFSRWGFLRRGVAREFAQAAIRDYEVKCPAPEIRARLLSGGNMQKLILARALDGAPRILLAAQPARGLDVGAVNAVHRRLIAARDAGAAVLLISEDLEELMSLSDRIAVMSRGRLSAPAPRGALSAREIGALMTGGAHAA